MGLAFWFGDLIADTTMNPMDNGKKATGLKVRHTTDAGEYLDRVGAFLQQRPVEHSVLLSTAATRRSVDSVGAKRNLWLWTENGEAVVAAAQHTPPHGAYLSTGPAEAMRTFAQTLWRLRPGLAGVAGLGTAPYEFATEWSRLGGQQATAAMQQGVYHAQEVITPLGIPGQVRPATTEDASLLRRWEDQFLIEAGVGPGAKDQVRSHIDSGLLFVWEADGAVVSMAAVTTAQSGVSRVHLVYTPPANRQRGFASACVAALTAREIAVGRTCMLYTDLANPTSNGIYQAVGYRRVGNAVQLIFPAPKTWSTPSR